MSAEHPTPLIERLGKIGNLITPVGIAILLILQAQFVSRKDFEAVIEKMDGRMQHQEIAIAQIVEQNKVNDRQDTQILDHERRIRELERTHP